MRIVFFGINSVYSILPLLAIREGFEVVAVITDKRKSSFSFRSFAGSVFHSMQKDTFKKSFSLQKTCDVYGIPYFEFDRVNNKECIDQLTLLKPDVICMSGFNEKIGVEILKIPVHGMYNAHSSVLPGNRGAHPFFWMIKNNKMNAGCTIHKVNEAFDDGPVVASSSVKIYEGSNLSIYNYLVAAEAARLFAEVLPKIATGSLTSSPQIKTTEALNRNPLEKDLLIKNTSTVSQALWLFNAYTDTLTASVETPSGIKKCIRLSKNNFDGAESYRLADGVIYILTA
ncbi:MAG: formyltransferase family protein [Bacteroidota bacterium]